MRIVHFEASPADIQLLVPAAPTDHHEYQAGVLTEATAVHALGAEAISVFVNSAVSKPVIDLLLGLKLIVTRSTGYDHIDVAYARSKGITVCNVPAYGSRTVAEFTVALMLGVSRKIRLATEHMQRGNWDAAALEGFNLEGKTLGIIGTGRIGQNVATMVRGFGMQVIAYDAFPNEQKAQELNFRYVPLNSLLSSADVVTLHVPATAETHHLLNQETIAQMKDGAILINTSRGDVVETEALRAALTSGKLSGAGLDVFEGEHEIRSGKQSPASAIIGMPNVLATPHIAFDTQEARAEIARVTMQNIESFSKGTPANTVTA